MQTSDRSNDSSILKRGSYSYQERTIKFYNEENAYLKAVGYLLSSQQGSFVRRKYSYIYYFYDELKK